ncbi:MAG: BspA family leucine-rich repeat surface protein [Bacilli bacterium]|nr:BspA family leucine-rich repeat surface protein [Bacilli bacterium]
MKDNKYIIPSLIAVGIIMVVIGSTFAYWNWQSTSAQKTAVSFTVGSTFSCSADGGGNITANNYFAPTDCDNSTYAVKREVVVNTTSQVTNEIINLSMDLNISNISPTLLQTDYFMYALTTNANSCNGAISGGSFKYNYDSDSHTVPLLVDEEFIGAESKTYYLYIWLDKEETNSNTMNTSFSASLEGSCTDSGNILKKVYAYLGGSSSYFKTSEYSGNITSVSFVNEINIPGNAINQWNVGTSPSNAGDVKAWLEDDGSGNNTFALKIGANGTIFTTQLANAFKNLSNVSNFCFYGLNTSETTNMSNMFRDVGRNAANFSLNLGSNFDTSKVTSMYMMFYNLGRNATSFNLNLGNRFNTSNVTEISSMFEYMGYNATNLNLDLSNNFDTSKVANMAYMFVGVGTKATDFNLNLGNQFNTSNVTNMHAMFAHTGRNANNFNLNLGNQFNTSRVIDMSHMFSNVGENATTFNLNLGSKFNTSNVTDMYIMFLNAGYSAIDFNLDLGNNFNTSNVTNMYSMFANVGNKTQTSFTLNLSAGNFTNVTDNYYMFYGFGNNKATIYVKDATAQQWILAQNSNFNASNVLIK